jgi:hypothetical protein
LKDAAVSRLQEHRRLDRIAQRVYWEDGRGCLLGCLTHSNTNSHKAAERLFGIELRVGYWLEAVFEGLPKELCEWWVIESAKAIPAGADLSLCHHQFSDWLLGESGLLCITDQNCEAIESVRKLNERAANGEVVNSEDWVAAESAAESAARAAAEPAAWSAWSAARSAAESAAWSAWSSARAAARAAAWSAWSARSAAESAAESAAWEKIANKSLEIFANAPTAETSDCPECVKEGMAVLAVDGVHEFSHEFVAN